MITEKQREERKGYIGSSDAAAVLGLSRWTTPLQLWAEKTGEVTRQDEPTLQMKLGNRLEEVVAELFTEQTGLKLRRANETIFSKDYPFLGANIDRAVVGKREGVECKTVTAFKAKEWAGDEIPQEYIIQCHHCLAVTGWERWHIAALIGNQEFMVKTIERDEKLLKDMIAKDAAFWNLVETKIMPGIITARDSDVLYELFPVSQPVTLALGDDVAKKAEYRASLIADLKLVEDNIQRTENEIKALMGTAEAATAGEYLITWRNQTQRRFDQKKFALEFPDVVEKWKVDVSFRKFEAKIPKASKR